MVLFINSTPVIDVSQIYKNTKNRYQNNNLIEKWGTDLNIEFLTEEFQMAVKHLKKNSEHWWPSGKDKSKLL